jgi:hypothetical protein
MTDEQDEHPQTIIPKGEHNPLSQRINVQQEKERQLRE